jgi:hypothetical protein
MELGLKSGMQRKLLGKPGILGEGFGEKVEVSCGRKKWRGIKTLRLMIERLVPFLVYPREFWSVEAKKNKLVGSGHKSLVQWADYASTCGEMIRVRFCH